MTPSDPKHGPKPDPPHSPELSDEDTQTLSLDELGIQTPSEPTKAMPAPPEKPTPPPAPEPPKAAKPAAAPEATARLEPPAAQQAESTARLDEAVAAGMTLSSADTLPPEPDDEPELPYSLQPVSLESEATPQVSRSTRQRKPFSAKVWIFVGALLGLAGAAWLYFHDWRLDFPVAAPRVQKAAEIPAGLRPPAQWHHVGSHFFGRDEIDQPWIFNAASGHMKIASQLIPRDFNWSHFAVVAEPPLEDYTRLAWLKTEGEPLLEIRDFSFADGKAGVPAADAPAPLNWVVSVGGEHHLPITVADTADPGVGTLVVVTAAAGQMQAWSPRRTADEGAVWSLKLDSPPVSPPVAWLDLRGSEPRSRLLVPTVKGLIVIDAAQGGILGAAEWPTPLDPALSMAMTPIRLGDRGWGWLGSNGAFAAQWRLLADGKPDLVWSAALPQMRLGAKAPDLLAFPDPDAADADQWVVKTEGGQLVWLNHAQTVRSQNRVEVSVIAADAAGALAAVDINGDGYQDIMGISDYLWYRPGPSTMEPNEKDAEDIARQGRRIPWGNELFSALGSEIWWDLKDDSLVGVYVDAKGQPQRVAMPLPKITTANIATLQDDWKRRRIGH